MALLTRTLDRLVGARFAVYGGGLAAIIGVRRFGPSWLEGPTFVATLTLMSLTYFAELYDRSEVDPSTTRLVAATGGVAVGAYVFVTVNRLAGSVFLLGSVLFLWSAVRTTGATDDAA